MSTETNEREALSIAFAALNRLAGRDSWRRTPSEDPLDPWESAESQGLAAIEACRAALYTPPAAADDWKAKAEAAQPATPPKWIDDPHDIEQGRMLNPAWLALHGLAACEAAALAEQPATQAGAGERCQHCIDRHDGFYGSFAPPCPDHDDDGKPRATPTVQQPATQAGAGEPYNGEDWELLAMALAEEEHDDIHRLIWEGGPVPEPWGEVWQRYEGDAKRMIELVRKHAPTTEQPGDAERFTIQQIAEACVYAEVSDGQFQSMLIALGDAARAAHGKGGRG